MKSRNFLIYISFSFWLFSFFIVEVYANGVPEPNLIREPYESLIIIFILFIIAVGFEFIVFTNKKFDFAPRNTRLLLTFLKINLITFPLTQILVYIVFIYARNYYWIYVLGIEICVILAEWRLILFEFDRKYDRTLYPRQVLKISILANFISFLLGFVPYIVLFLFQPLIFFL